MWPEFYYLRVTSRNNTNYVLASLEHDHGRRLVHVRVRDVGARVQRLADGALRRELQQVRHGPRLQHTALHRRPHARTRRTARHAAHSAVPYLAPAGGGLARAADGLLAGRVLGAARVEVERGRVLAQRARRPLRPARVLHTHSTAHYMTINHAIV